MDEACRCGRLRDLVLDDLSVPSTKYVVNLPGEASRPAALLLPQIFPIFSVVTPCQPGAALRHLGHLLRARDTSSPWCRSDPRTAGRRPSIRGNGIARAGEDARISSAGRGAWRSRPR